MRRKYPFSLIFFVATGIVYVLQLIPIIGIFLMFGFAFVWSAALVNVGMIGTLVEALTGYVSRRWLMLPLAFYGGFYAIAVQEQSALNALTASSDAANAEVSIKFDPAREALVFDSYLDASRFVSQYGVPVAYSIRSDRPEGYESHRVVEETLCAKVRYDLPIRNAARIQTQSVYDDGPMGGSRTDNRFCVVSMPEKPEFPHVSISRNETKITKGTLPITLVTTEIGMPDGRHFEILGGVATPLKWLPAPLMGCVLNSGRASWDCHTEFWRSFGTPIASGFGKVRRDSLPLAAALGFKPVDPSKRQASDTNLVLEKIALLEEATITRQFDILDGMIADHVAIVANQWVELVARRPKALASRADALMSGIERAASVANEKRPSQVGRNGLVLAQAFAELPRDKFIEFGPRLLLLYSKADDKHWLWDAKPLLSRLGDLGPDAIPYLMHPRALHLRLEKAVAAIEGLCRVGEAARAEAEAALLEMWSKSRDFHYNERVVLFVAMRRLGISPPPLSEDKNGHFAYLQGGWANVTPQSPPGACAVSAGSQARLKKNEY